jgi:hypothetical protein
MDLAENKLMDSDQSHSLHIQRTQILMIIKKIKTQQQKD